MMPAPKEISTPKVAGAPSPWLMAALLALGTLILYWPAAQHAFLHYDDNVYVSENPHVANGFSWANAAWDFTHTVTGNWHPLTMLSHTLDCQIYGLQPWGHHLTSVLFHAANAGLVFLLLRRLTGAVWRSALVAALFAWHPVNVESVAWVAERKSVLSGFLGLLSLLCYVQYAGVRSQEPGVRGQNEPAAGGRSLVYYWLAFLFLALGLMSKALLVTWPFVMLLLDWRPLGRLQRTGVWRLLWEKTPFFALIIAASAATLLTHQEENDVLNISWGLRLENVLVCYCRYLGIFFWPSRLAVFYPHPGYRPLAEVALAAGLLAVLSAACWMLRRRLPLLTMGWLWFLGTLAPVIGFVQVGAQAMADRHAYLPCIGIFIIAVWGVAEMTRNAPMARASGAVAGVAGMVLCLALTRHELGYWQNDETLFRRALAVTKNNFVAHNNLGIVLASRGDLDAAMRQFQEAADTNPNYADAHANLGHGLLEQGRAAAAIAQFQDNLRLRPDDPDAHFWLGRALLEAGRTGEAITQYQAAFKSKAYDASVYYELGNQLVQRGETNAALGLFAQTIHLQPDHSRARNRLGDLLAQQGKFEAAISQFQGVLQIDPNDAEAHCHLANALLKTEQAPAAASQFQEAIRLQPDFPAAHNGLGIVLAAQDQLDAAIREFQEAIREKSDYAAARTNLARALALKPK